MRGIYEGLALHNSPSFFFSSLRQKVNFCNVGAEREKKSFHVVYSSKGAEGPGGGQ